MAVVAAIGAAGGVRAQETGPAPAGVNLKGFSEAPVLMAPGLLGTLGPLQRPTNVLPADQNFVAGPITDPNAAQNRFLGAGSPPMPSNTGAFAGFTHRNARDPNSAYGLNLQFSGAPERGGDSWMVQPGVDYSRALTPTVQLNSRLFTTYGTDRSAPAALGPGISMAPGERGAADAGFKDVGLSLGLDYSLSQSWGVQTQASVTRPVSQQRSGEGRDEVQPSQLFGGVIINYKF
jgi:hypothetical protein